MIVNTYILQLINKYWMELSEIGEKVFEVEAIVKQRVRKVTCVPMFLSIFVAMPACKLGIV